MIFLLIPFLVFIDLFTKYLSNIYLQDKINVIWNFFYLKFIYNYWIAFSIPITWIILKIITIIIITILGYYYITQEKKKNNKLIDYWFVLVISWALWNWYERIFNWKVIDFLAINNFSIFNLADVYITLGVLLYLYSLYSDNKKDEWK